MYAAVCCHGNKMAAQQHINNSSLYKMLCTYNFFDSYNKIITILTELGQKIIAIY